MADSDAIQTRIDEYDAVITELDGKGEDTSLVVAARQRAVADKAAAVEREAEEATRQAAIDAEAAAWAVCKSDLVALGFPLTEQQRLDALYARRYFTAANIRRAISALQNIDNARRRNAVAKDLLNRAAGRTVFV